MKSFNRKNNNLKNRIAYDLTNYYNYYQKFYSIIHLVDRIFLFLFLF